MPFRARTASVSLLLTLSLAACTLVDRSGTAPVEEDAGTGLPPGQGDKGDADTADAEPGDRDADARDDAKVEDAGDDASADEKDAEVEDAAEDADEPLVCDDDCDDGVDCTVDSCENGVCVHAVDDALCEEGASCDLEGGGCSVGSACAETEDCDFPVCSMNRQCDPVLAACTYDALDRDGDGVAPENCGGKDCNDDDAKVAPGAVERCNGEDDDCDGEADEDARCPAGEICQEAGTPQASCGCAGAAKSCTVGGKAQCVDTLSDAANCGDCGVSCGPGGACKEGACTCTGGKKSCPAAPMSSEGGGEGGGPAGPEGTTYACLDVSSDPMNCGGCGVVCAPSEGLCVDGACLPCGGDGEPCCGGPAACNASMTPVGLSSLGCRGTPGTLDSECTSCGLQYEQPCCSLRVGQYERGMCLGDLNGQGSGARCDRSRNVCVFWRGR